MAFDIDGGPRKLTFAARLARENGWSLDYSKRVVDEYKRFLFLTAACGHPCTPSDQVDQAWHLHLSYTDSYWNRLCSQVIGIQIHHNPTEGGEEENDKFDEWYNRTLETYREVFGENAPSDIWPDSNIRFGEDIAFERVNLSRNWILPKRRLRLTALAITMGAIVAGCGAAGRFSADMGFLFVAGVILLIVLIYIIAKTTKYRGDSGCSGCGAHGGYTGDGGSGCGSGCGGGGCSGGD